MTKTGYIDLINRFWRITDGKASSSEIALYFALLNQFNEAKWQNPLGISNDVFMTSFNWNIRTLASYRSKLAERDLVRFKCGRGRGQKTLYLLPIKNNQEWMFDEAMFESKKPRKQGNKRCIQRHLLEVNSDCKKGVFRDTFYENKKVHSETPFTEEKVHSETPFTRQTPYLDNNIDNIVVVDGACARMREGKEIFEVFFDANSERKIEAICSEFEIERTTLEKMAKTILAEWEEAPPHHFDLREAVIHLYRTLRKRLTYETKHKNYGSKKNIRPSAEERQDAFRAHIAKKLAGKG